jgi:hypothetical protein
LFSRIGAQERLYSLQYCRKAGENFSLPFPPLDISLRKESAAAALEQLKMLPRHPLGIALRNESRAAALEQLTKLSAHPLDIALRNESAVAAL